MLKQLNLNAKIQHIMHQGKDPEKIEMAKTTECAAKVEDQGMQLWSEGQGVCRCHLGVDTESASSDSSSFMATCDS